MKMILENKIIYNLKNKYKNELKNTKFKIKNNKYVFYYL